MKLNLLREAFNEKGISIKTLSKETGLAYATCYGILSGEKKNPTVISVYKISRYLNISIDELMGRDDDEKGNIKS